MSIDLKRDYDTLSRFNVLKDYRSSIPDYIINNLNPAFELREYQKEAIARFMHYMEAYDNRRRPTHLLFNMATGSGKTLLMAANILYLYTKGYRNFLFFVNSTNIIEKTKDNFLNPLSSKYLFNENIVIDGKRVRIHKVTNFQDASPTDINIVFTTIQGLHTSLNNPRENAVTIEDFTNDPLVIISDEAHHINAWTKARLGKTEALAKKTWEYTVNNILNIRDENIMLEYTATVDLTNEMIRKKYSDKLIYAYSLKEFRQDGYSKDVKVLVSDMDLSNRMLQAIILSQYRRKVAEMHKIHLKPVILFKSKKIQESKENAELFHRIVSNLTANDIRRIRDGSNGNVLQKAFEFFERQGITLDNLAIELREEFSEEKCMLLDSKNIDDEKQLLLNDLESSNNRIRAIFAVNMLNEGWDVLNLYDIVRLYDKRDGKWKGARYIPGPTTISEVQLIGRGARYYPFKLVHDHDRFKRKFDEDPDNELKILEELYYHSAYTPRYIVELKSALKESGLLARAEPRVIHLRVKESFKKTEFWKDGLVFINECVASNEAGGPSVTIDQSITYGPVTLKSGMTQELSIFATESQSQDKRVTRRIELDSFADSILWKAISRLEFYRFNRIKNYFPEFRSMTDLIAILKKLSVEVIGEKRHLEQMTPDDKLEVCMVVLKQLESQIKENYSEFKGTKTFVPHKIKDVVVDKILHINVDNESDQEFGVSMRESHHPNLRLDLSTRDWYVYDENYGTSEEKHFIRFMESIMQRLNTKFSDIYLLRNAKLFKIYRFRDGRAIEPDFVLFLKELDSGRWIQYQLFIEAKGSHLLITDQWKQAFLEEIEKEYKLEVIQSDDFHLIGLPFYNKRNENNFLIAFKNELNLN